jgi:hypothetical protein
VVADVGLRRRGVDRLGQARAVDQSRGQLVAAHGAALVVLGEAGAGEVAAHDRFDLEDLEALDAQRAAGELGRHVLGGDHMVGDDVLELLEPPQAQRGQERALAGHRGRQHHVVDADAVGGDEDQVVSVGVDVADLALVNELHGYSPVSRSTPLEQRERHPTFVPRRRCAERHLPIRGSAA